MALEESMTLSFNKLHKPWNYLLLTLGLTWLFWIPAALTGIPEPDLAPTILHYLGGSMPFIVTMVILFRQEDRLYRREYWQRLFQLIRIPWPWLLLTILSAPLIFLLAGGLDAVLGGSGLAIEYDFSGGHLALLSFAVFMLLFGPLPEEMGWRGYALDWLQKQHNPLVSSLILGTIWGIWHLPLFFIEGSYQYALRGTPSIWFFFLGFLPQTILMTWLFNNTRRSTLSAVLLHWMVNLTGEFFELSLRAELFSVLLWFAAALMIVLIWRAGKIQENTKSTGPG